MARRRTGPPLYDLITTRSNGPETRIKRTAREARQPKQPKQPKPHKARRNDSAGDEGDNKLFDWLHPGRKIAFPVGYVLVAAAGVLALFILAYVFGHGRGTVDAKNQFDQSLLESSHSAEIGRNTTDPLLAMREGTLNNSGSQSRDNSAQPKRSQPASNIAGKPAAATNRPSNATNPQSRPSTAGPVASDPRVVDKYYYVLATTRRDGAIRLAEFCRKHGLEAYVIGGHNDRFSQVIALPALETSSSSNPSVSSMRELITRIGRLWEKTEPGATNLSDAYVMRHKS